MIGVFPRRTPNCKPEKMLERVQQLNTNTQLICEKYGVMFCDWTLDVLDSEPGMGVDGTSLNTTNFVDDVHFSVQGYIKFAKRILDLVQ
jgi:lysophospholipase L1-like esterase